MHARRLARSGHVQIRDVAMRRGAAQDIGVQRALGCYVIDVAALAGQETAILETRDRLARSELAHRWHPFALASVGRRGH